MARFSVPVRSQTAYIAAQRTHLQCITGIDPVDHLSRATGSDRYHMRNGDALSTRQAAEFLFELRARIEAGERLLHFTATQA